MYFGPCSVFIHFLGFLPLRRFSCDLTLLLAAFPAWQFNSFLRALAQVKVYGLQGMSICAPDLLKLSCDSERISPATGGYLSQAVTRCRHSIVCLLLFAEKVRKHRVLVFDSLVGVTADLSHFNSRRVQVEHRGGSPAGVTKCHRQGKSTQSFCNPGTPKTAGQIAVC